MTENDRKDGFFEFLLQFKNKIYENIFKTL